MRSWAPLAFGEGPPHVGRDGGWLDVDDARGVLQFLREKPRATVGSVSCFALLPCAMRPGTHLARGTERGDGVRDLRRHVGRASVVGAGARHALQYAQASVVPGPRRRVALAIAQLLGFLAPLPVPGDDEKRHEQREDGLRAVGAMGAGGAARRHRSAHVRAS